MQFSGQGIIEIIMVILGVLIPYAANLFRKYVADNRDAYRLQKIDAIAESALELVRFNNPKWTWVSNIDQIKDALVGELLRDSTVPLKNPVIANRVAVKAIAKARNGG